MQRVSIETPEDIRYWTERFECTPDELRDAVAAIGPENPENVHDFVYGLHYHLEPGQVIGYLGSKRTVSRKSRDENGDLFYELDGYPLPIHEDAIANNIEPD
jgi:hypothetical protein